MGERFDRPLEEAAGGGSGAGRILSDARFEDEAAARRAFARLFPGAPGSEPLRLVRPPIGVLAARVWHRASVAVLLVGGWALATLQLFAPGGTVLGWGVHWFLLALATTIVGAAMYLLASNRLRRRGAIAPTTWEQWAALRGFRTTTQRAGGPLRLEPSRDYGSLYAGALDGGMRVTIGNCYVHGPGGTLHNLGLGVVAAIVQLPADSGERFPSSVLDRFLVGRGLRSNATKGLRELRLESIALDEACELRVDAGSDDLDWYDLLDPKMVDGIARDWPVSWIQHGSLLVVYEPAPIGTLDAAQLDTVCAAAEAIARRFRTVLSRPRTAPDAAALAASRERVASHARRRRIASALLTLTCIALVAVPAIIIEQRRDARRDARAAAMRVEQSQFEARYAVLETTFVVQECLAVLPAGADRRTCLTAHLRERERITASGVVTPERFDAIEVERADGDAITVRARSRDGVRWTATVRTADPDEVERTCAPRTTGCDGRWGIDG